MSAAQHLTSTTQALLAPLRVALDALKEQTDIDQAALDRVRAMKLAAVFEVQELSQIIGAAIAELLCIGRELNEIEPDLQPTRGNTH